MPLGAAWGSLGRGPSRFSSEMWFAATTIESKKLSRFKAASLYDQSCVKSEFDDLDSFTLTGSA